MNELDIENCLLSDKQCCEKNKKRSTVWMNALGDTLVQNNKVNYWGPLTGYRSNTGGVVAGIDRMLSEYVYAGAIGAYTNSHLHFQEGKGTGDINSGYMGAYVSGIGKVVYGNASLIGSWNTYSVERHIKYPGVDLTAKSSHGGNQQNDTDIYRQ